MQRCRRKDAAQRCSTRVELRQAVLVKTGKRGEGVQGSWGNREGRRRTRSNQQLVLSVILFHYYITLFLM